MTQRSVILLSGGLDSTVALALLLQEREPKRVVALFVDYSQWNAKDEITATRNICTYYRVLWLRRVRIEGLWTNNPMTSAYSWKPGKRAGPRNHEQAELGFRNGVLLSAAAAMAVEVEADEIWIGTHPDAPEWEGPHYADVTPDFMHCMQGAFLTGIPEGRVPRLRVPFEAYERPSLINLKGKELNVPFALTYSCFMANGPCGTCPKCLNRAERFAKQNLTDPTSQKEAPHDQANH